MNAPFADDLVVFVPLAGNDQGVPCRQPVDRRPYGVRPIGLHLGPAAVRRVQRRLRANRFVMRTDVKSYYASIDHHRLLDRLAVHVRDKAVLNLIGQYLRRTAERGGEFFDYDRGISLGCPLSPLIGAFFLDDLDRRMARLGLFYVRFMDDVLVLSPTRWKLRRAVRAVNRVLGSLGSDRATDGGGVRPREP